VRGARIVHADPPWSYGNRAICRGDGTKSELPYGVLTYAPILAHLDAAFDAAADDAYLFLWTTWPHLALWLAAAEGNMRWRYLSGGVWAKTGGIGIGLHWRGDSEPVLLYAKGKPRPRLRNLRNTYVGPRTRHSEKPDAWLGQVFDALSDPGDLVLDLYAGMAPAARACIAVGRRYVGAEIDAARHAEAVASLTAGKAVTITSVPPNTRKEAPTVYVKSVKSNVKKGAKTELGRLTLIVGPNGIGKSSIVNGVELALTGRASDVVGRAEVAKGIDLLALAPANDAALWAEVTLSDGRTARWECERNTKTGGAREATSTLPTDVKPSFPVRQVREALAGSPATVRAWLVGRIGATVSEDTILNLFPEDLRAAYSDLCRPLFGSPAQTLLDAREAAGKQARNAGADAKAATALAEQTGASLAVEPNDAEIEVARRRVREAAVALAGTMKPRHVYDLPRLRVAAETKIATYARLSEQAAALEAKLSGAPSVNAEVARTRDALTRVLTFTAQHHAADCLVCQNVVPHGAHTKMLTRAEALTNAARVDVETMQVQAEHERVQRVLGDALREAQDAVASFRAAETAMSTAGDDAVPVEDVAARLREAEEIVRALEGTRAKWEDVRAAQARARDAKGRARLYADLSDAIEDAIGRVLERARVDFVVKVQSYLPVEDAFDLVLTTNGKDVCQFGFTRDGVLHTALSGAEWARLTLALAAAVTSDDEANLSVLTPEDRAFDPETLAAVLRGMSNAPGQVILCSPVHPAGRAPKGWTVIDLSPPKAPKAKKADGVTLGGSPDGDDAPMDGRFDAVAEAK
jgi:hypothetical protein